MRAASGWRGDRKPRRPRRSISTPLLRGHKSVSPTARQRRAARFQIGVRKLAGGDLGRRKDFLVQGQGILEVAEPFLHFRLTQARADSRKGPLRRAAFSNRSTALSRPVLLMLRDAASPAR